MKQSFPGSSPLPVRYALAAAGVPFALAIIVGGATLLRLRAEADRAEEMEEMVVGTCSQMSRPQGARRRRWDGLWRRGRVWRQEPSFRDSCHG